MQTYIGTKVIQAEPMRRCDYVASRCWVLPDNENGADEGYRVVYPDGYVSWTPAPQFEEAYQPIGAGIAEAVRSDVQNLIASKTSDVEHLYSTDAAGPATSSPTLRDFNPTGSDVVEGIKRRTDELMAFINDHCAANRHRSIALTNYEQAAMWAVKSLFV